MTKHLLLIDDHALFRAGIGMMLSASIDKVEIAEAASIEQALACTTPEFDLLLLDIQLQGLNGLEGISQLKEKWPWAKIVIVSATQDAKLHNIALERGADGIICKSETPERMMHLLKQILACPIAATDSTTPATTASCTKLLTPRQSEVLELLSQGLSNKMIGRRLNLSENTVRGHVQATLSALEVSSRYEAAFVARRRGLIS